MVVECKGCISEGDHAGVEPYSYIEIQETFSDKLFSSLEIMKAGLTVTNKTLNLFKISQVTPSFYEETTLIRGIKLLNNGETI